MNVKQTSTRQAALTLALALAISGCAVSPEQKGALEGGAVGTIVGGIAGGLIGDKTGGKKGTGAAIGAAVGGTLGAVIGYRMNRQKEQLEQVKGVESVNYDQEKQRIEATLRILFDVDKSVIKPSEAMKLDQLASVFMGYPENIVLLEGHTDSDGSDAYNQQLSERRAASIENYLRAKNLNIASLSSLGYGEARPVSSNATPDGKAQNRRVEIKISVDPNRVPQNAPAAGM